MRLCLSLLQTNEILRLNGVYKKLLTNSKVDMYEGGGKIIDPHTVEVQETGGKSKRFTASKILVATGGRAVRLNIPGKVLFPSSSKLIFSIMSEDWFLQF